MLEASFLQDFAHNLAPVLNEAQKDLINNLLAINAVQFGDFTFSSGKKSSVYVDLRRTISYPDLIKCIIHEMRNLRSARPEELVCGVPYGSLPLACAYSYYTNTPMIMPRTHAKSHGSKVLIEGVFQKGQSCLLIEDMISTGKSVIATIQQLSDAGIIVTDVLACASWGIGGVERIHKLNVNCKVLLDMRSVVDYLYTQATLSTEQHASIRSWINQNRV